MIKPEDLRVDVYSNGAPGNMKSSAVRITHMPSGTVVECGDHPSQLRNKAAALQKLRERLGEPEPAVNILRLPVEHHDMTIGEYLATLAIGLVRDEVTAKYGFTGGSDWRYDLYDTLGAAGLACDASGGVDQRKADDLLETALLRLVQDAP
jgi:hypothetical protein